MLFLLAVLLLAGVFGQRDPAYDHQATTYYANHGESSFENLNLNVTTFFSPDWSVQTFVEVIESATESIDVGTPGFSSWSGCTQFDTRLVGCAAPFVRDHEKFPIFQALLNAIHRGVKVTILTNGYNVYCKPGLIDPLDFLCVAGADCHLFRTLTFLHTKYIQVDGKRVVVSSVNYSYTSFMKNREAGVVVDGEDAPKLISYLDAIFKTDLSASSPWIVNKYNETTLATIMDRTPIPVVIPTPPSHNGAYVSHRTTIQGQFPLVELVGNPDNAWSFAKKSFASAQSSVRIMIYQITDDPFCTMVVGLAQQSNLTLQFLFSDRIFDQDDWESAQRCYTRLYNAGQTVKKTARDQFTFSHQKFWIIDDTSVYMSSGNAGMTDFPDGSTTFPAYGHESWRKTNRDHTIHLQHPKAVSAFRSVMDADYESGYTWHPYMVEADRKRLFPNEKQILEL